MAQERSADNTRRHRRQTVRVLVDYRTATGVCCDYATTLGAGGLFLQTNETLRKGEIVKLRFKLPGHDTLHEIEGRVAWHRAQPKPGEPAVAPGIGIQFSKVASGSQLARELEDYES